MYPHSRGVNIFLFNSQSTVNYLEKKILNPLPHIFYIFSCQSVTPLAWQIVVPYPIAISPLQN